MIIIGSVCFGIVVGWVTYRTLRRKSDGSAISDIASVIGAIGGGAITAIFQTQEVFGAYCIGLAVGFFGYFIVGLIVNRSSAESWMIRENDAGDSWMSQK